MRGMTRSQKTEFIHAAITREGGKLVPVKSVLYENKVKKTEQTGNKEVMDGRIYAEAVKRFDGPQALKEAVADGSIFVKKLVGCRCTSFQSSSMARRAPRTTPSQAQR